MPSESVRLILEFNASYTASGKKVTTGYEYASAFNNNCPQSSKEYQQYKFSNLYKGLYTVAKCDLSQKCKVVWTQDS